MQIISSSTYVHWIDCLHCCFASWRSRQRRLYLHWLHSAGCCCSIDPCLRFELLDRLLHLCSVECSNGMLGMFAGVGTTSAGKRCGKCGRTEVSSMCWPYLRGKWCKCCRIVPTPRVLHRDTVCSCFEWHVVIKLHRSMLSWSFYKIKNSTKIRKFVIWIGISG